MSFMEYFDSFCYFLLGSALTFYVIGLYNTWNESTSFVHYFQHKSNMKYKPQQHQQHDTATAATTTGRGSNDMIHDDNDIHNNRYVKPTKFYLNLYFLDRKELVRNIIRSKVSRNRPIIRALAKRAAVALLKNGISEKVATTLINQVPKKLGIMGIHSEATIAYLHNSYVCIEVNMYDIDLIQLIEYQSDLKTAEKVDYFLKNISIPLINDFIITKLLLIFRTKMMEKLPSELRFKLMASMNAELEIIATTEDDLGPILLNTIQNLNTASSGAEGARAAADSVVKNDDT